MSESIPFEMIKILNQLEDLEKRMAAVEARGKRKPKSKELAVIEKPGHTLIQYTPSIQFHLKDELLDSWKDTYPAEYLEHEWKALKSWVLTNPERRPKSNWGRFFNDNFRRGYERYRKTLKGQKPLVTDDELLKILRGQQDAGRSDIHSGVTKIGGTS